jgi:hypothetical protein
MTATCTAIHTVPFLLPGLHLAPFLCAGPAIPNAFFPLRAGAVCMAMTRCSNVPAACSLNVTSVTSSSRVVGGLDLCTAEGVAGGSQLPRVLTSGEYAGAT